MHLGGILPRPAARERTTAECCHGRVFRGYAAEICCRCLSGQHWRAAAMKEPGALEGASTPPPRVGHLRCARPLVHAPQCFREVGGTAQPARCRVRLGALTAGAWGPLGRSWVATTARTFIAGAPPFNGLIARNGFESALFRWATMRSFRVLRSSAVSCAEAKCALTFMLGAANVVKGMSWAFARQWEIWQAR